jgi:hypothetical protein
MILLLNSSLFGKLLEYKVFSFYVKCFCTYIFYVRGLFTHPKGLVIFCYAILPSITTLFITLHQEYPTKFSNLSYAQFCIVLGITLLTYDYLGSMISTILIEQKEHPLSLLLLPLLTKSKHGNIIKRHVYGTAFNAYFIGKSPMTAGGRAALLAGICSGAAYLANGYFDRNAANNRSAADRDAADRRAGADREAAAREAAADRAAAREARQFKAYENEFGVWKDQPADTRGPMPRWKEEQK